MFGKIIYHVLLINLVIHVLYTMMIDEFIT